MKHADSNDVQESDEQDVKDSEVSCWGQQRLHGAHRHSPSSYFAVLLGSLYALMTSLLKCQR
jgi:hypothetical protein